MNNKSYEEGYKEGYDDGYKAAENEGQIQISKLHETIHILETEYANLVHETQYLRDNKENIAVGTALRNLLKEIKS